MKYITFHECGMRVNFRIRDDRTIELADFSAVSDSCDLPDLDQITPRHAHSSFQLLAVQVTGETTTKAWAYKHSTGSESSRFQYRNHTITENENGKLLCIIMETDRGLRAEYYMQFYKKAAMVRTWSSITNISDADIGIEYVSSFLYEGLCKNGTKHYYDKTDIYVPYNSWSNECQWQKYDIADVGLSGMPIGGYRNPGMSNNRYHYGSATSWSTCEHLPMGIARDRETGEVYYFQVEHSGAWKIEYGSTRERKLYLALLGPNEESMWWKNLKPGQTFTTVPAAFGVTMGEESDAIAALTAYRRCIRRKNKDNKNCYIVFNDYMNCLMGDPTEEKEKQIIDRAAAMGCEYYCMDCGWYDKGPWWNRVGEWKEAPERFPNGMKTVCDYAHSKGLKMGVWLEIEVMGVECELAHRLPDDWFICTHGKRRIDDRRYLLDFRNPRVRQYCREVIDRLVQDYGVDFFKMDYNVTTGFGSDLNCDSMGDAMLEHCRCLYQWYREIFEAYPDLVIESCSCGAQRMDYGILALQSLQSTSDQTDYISNSYIAANAAAALTPEQAGTWVYPYVDEAEHVIYNMVNGLLLRPYISGLVWNISDENFALMQEGVAVYKQIRKDIPSMLPFFPLGFASFKKDVLSYGLQNNSKAYLAVFTPRTDYARIDLSLLKKKLKSVHVIYPKAENCSYKSKGNMLEVKMPQTACARLFELTFDELPDTDSL